MQAGKLTDELLSNGAGAGGGRLSVVRGSNCAGERNHAGCSPKALSDEKSKTGPETTVQDSAELEWQGGKKIGRHPSSPGLLSLLFFLPSLPFWIFGRPPAQPDPVCATNNSSSLHSGYRQLLLSSRLIL